MSLDASATVDFETWQRGDRALLLADAVADRHTALFADRPDLERRLRRHTPDFWRAYGALYGDGYDRLPGVLQLFDTLFATAANRGAELQTVDRSREADPAWFQHEGQVGMMLYVDLFAGDLEGVRAHLPYLQELGVTYLHLMPLLKPREGPNDGGYAVQSYRAVDPRLGTMDDLRHLAADLRAAGMELVIDFVMNHTAREHAWAQAALAGDEHFQKYYLLFPDRRLPDAYERTLPEVFPDFAPGNFSYVPELEQWAWTTFYRFQWDLDYRNPDVFEAMLGEMLFLANLGVDVLRLDAVPFLWKQMGTNCQNLPEAHEILRAYRALVRIAAPGVLFKSEAIVAPEEIIRYLGTGGYAGKECDIGYNAALMCHLWHALAAENTQLLQAMLRHLPHPPIESAWLNYIRCHDDIGWGISDADAAAVGQNGLATRRWLAHFYAGDEPPGFAEGYYFQVNDATGEARTSGTTAALVGLQQAQIEAEADATDRAVARFALLHRIIFAMQGIPLLYSGDEIGQLNDTTYLLDDLKASDNRWLHRPAMNWAKAERRRLEGTVEHRLFHEIRRLAAVRKACPALHVRAEEHVLATRNDRLFVVERARGEDRLLLVANFSGIGQTLAVADLPPRWQTPHLHDLLADAPYHALGGEVLVGPYEALWLIPAASPRPATHARTRLSVEVKTAWGEEVYLAGPHPALGGGDEQRATGPLDASAYPAWTIELELPRHTALTFRWLKRRDDHVVERSPYRYALLPSGDVVRLAD